MSTDGFEEISTTRVIVRPRGRVNHWSYEVLVNGRSVAKADFEGAENKAERAGQRALTRWLEQRAKDADATPAE